MKVSLNLIKQLINFELPSVDELVSRVNQQLGGVEEVIDLKAKYGGVRIVRVVECEKHPNADRLSVTKIDDGGVADVPRDDNATCKWFAVRRMFMLICGQFGCRQKAPSQQVLMTPSRSCWMRDRCVEF